MDANKLLAAIAIMVIIVGPLLGVIYLIVNAIKDIIWYKEDCKYRYAQLQRLQKDLDDLEEDIEAHKDFDWTKEPEATTKTSHARPGSNAHYEAWREEQIKK